MPPFKMFDGQRFRLGKDGSEPSIVVSSSSQAEANESRVLSSSSTSNIHTMDDLANGSCEQEFIQILKDMASSHL